MNLTALFEKDQAITASLNDLSWMQDSGLARKDDPYLNLEGVKNPNNIKPQLEMEWGLGGPDVNLDEPAGVVQRNLPEDSEVDSGGVIVFARDMQNRGFRASQIVKALKAKYSADTLKKAATGLKEQFRLDGIVGRIAVDGRGYKSCLEALKAASNSPYKRFIKHVIGCGCGDPHMIPAKECGTFAETASSGNGIDDFFASSGETKKELVSHCRTSMLHILSAQGDLDTSELDQSLIEMTNTGGLPAGIVAGVRKNAGSNIIKLRNAFRYMDLQTDAVEGKMYSAPVDNSEFKINRADNEVELGGEMMPDIDVDERTEMSEVGLEEPPVESLDVEPVDYSPMPIVDDLWDDGMQVEVSPPPAPDFMDDIGLIDMPDMSQIPAEMMDETNLNEMTLFDLPEETETMVVDARPGELGIEFDDSSLFDMSMDSIPTEPEFVDSDNIQIDEPDEPTDDLDVDMRPNMEI